jgi:hypothetical protein
MAVTYKNANEPDLLDKMFSRIESAVSISSKDHSDNRDRDRTNTKIAATLKQYRAQIISNNDKLGQYLKELSPGDPDFKDKSDNMRADCNDLNAIIIKKAINENLALFHKMTLSDSEQLAIKYLDFNPRLVMIFDDCTEILEKHKKASIWSKLFYVGRHQKMTIIIAAHSDVVTLPAIKKNAFNIMFTDSASASGFANRPTNDIPKDARVRMQLLSAQAFNQPDKPFQKIVYEREQNRLLKYTAKKHEKFTFSGAQIWEYMERVQAKSGTLSSNNPYANDFM